MARKAAVAGRFYPGRADQLKTMLADCIPDIEEPVPALGLLSPHAGYVFSGRTAGEAFGRVEVPSTVVVLNPSHNYRQPPCALWTGGPWQTPLGPVDLHQGICKALADLPVVTPDDEPHRPEHSGEVILPFLQYCQSDLRIAVICVTAGAQAAQLKDLGQGIAQILRENGEDEALVVASSDMSHERGGNALEVVNEHDPLAIEKMEDLDPDGLIQVCRENNITMCGVLPAAAMMVSVRERGGSEGELVHRATSADSPQGRGDYVVGYAGMIFR